MQRNRRKTSVGLPQKKMKMKIKFNENILCELNIAMAGKDKETLTDSERERFTLDTCTHPMWPPFMPQCKTCFMANKCTTVMVDKKGKEYRIVTPPIKDQKSQED